MPVLINPENNEVHEFGPEESQKLLQKGWLVPLINREGVPEAIPYHEGQEYLGEGYTLPSDAQLDHLLKQTKYNATSQKTLAFAEGAARGLTGPAYDVLAPKTGLTTKENIHERKEFNPELATAGEVTGLVGGTVAGAGLPGLIGKAGAAAGTLGKVAGTLGKVAAQGAAEGALYKAAEKLDERVLGDPEALGEKLMGHIGLSALLGAGAGAAFLPLSKMVNQSGRLTQKAAEKMSGEGVVGKVTDKILDTATDLTLPGIMRPAAKMAKKAIVNSVLAIAPEKEAVLNQLMHLGDLAEKTSSLIENKAAGIFAPQIEKMISDTPAKKEEPSTKEPEFHGLGTMVMDHAADPQKLIDQMTNATTIMASAAPDVSNALTANVARGVNFLAGKLPQAEKQGLLDSEPKLQRKDIQQFNRYAEIVENPISVLDHVKNATLLPQDLEALTSVYPGMYQAMKTNVMGKLIEKMGKQKSNLLPYNKRLSLSLFLGTPLDSTIKGQSIMRNQQAFGAMQVQRQMQSQTQRLSRTGLGKMDPLRDLTRAQRTNLRR